MSSINRAQAVLDIPRIAVIGGQSAGKRFVTVHIRTLHRDLLVLIISSLVEAVSGVSLFCLSYTSKY